MATQLLEYKGNQFVDELSNVVVYICLAAAILSTVYAVYIAYLFFTASDQNKRKAAKDRLIKTIASCLIIFTAAAILKSLNIEFVKDGLSGSFESTEPTPQDLDLLYNNTAELSLTVDKSSDTKGEFIIYGDSIITEKTKEKIEEVCKGKIKWENFLVSGFNYNLPDNNNTASERWSQALSFTADANNPSNVKFTFYDYAPARVPCCFDSSKNRYVNLQIFFRISGSDPDYLGVVFSIKIKLQIKASSKDAEYHLQQEDWDVDWH